MWRGRGWGRRGIPPSPGSFKGLWLQKPSAVGGLPSAPLPGFLPPPPFLSSGHFGVVKRCQEQSTGTFYAAKCVKVRKRKGSRLGVDREQVEREVWILQQLEHPSIMRLHDTFASKTEMVLILEL